MTSSPQQGNERLPGDFFRAMGALYLPKKPDACRAWLAEELQDELREAGVEYHVRTLKRQLTGKVAIVLPVGKAMQHGSARQRLKEISPNIQ